MIMLAEAKGAGAMEEMANEESGTEGWESSGSEG